MPACAAISGNGRQGDDPAMVAAPGRRRRRETRTGGTRRLGSCAPEPYPAAVPITRRRGNPRGGASRAMAPAIQHRRPPMGGSVNRSLGGMGRDGMCRMAPLPQPVLVGKILPTMGIIGEILGGITDRLDKHQRRRIEDAEALLDRATKENTELRIQLTALEHENAELKGQLRATNQPSRPAVHAEAIPLLRRLVQDSQSVDIEDLESWTRLQRPKLLYHLEKLSSLDLVCPDSSWIDGSDRWEATNAGRAYIIENNLLEQ